MRSIPATRRARPSEAPLEIELAAESVLPLLPIPGPVTRAILALFDKDAPPTAFPPWRVLH